MIKFNNPCTICVAGQTGSGKTSLIKKIIAHKDTLFTIPPKTINYFYAIWQPLYNDMAEMGVKFVQGLPENYDDYTDPPFQSMIIIDDQFFEFLNDKQSLSLFIRTSHHR